MRELSLNVLDIAQNSVSANASLIQIEVNENTSDDTLTIIITDNGKGMTHEQVEKVVNPFYTTRTTRRVGLGVPFFKMAAEMSGGSFSIKSEVGKGTIVTAIFGLSNVDRMPLGDMTSTISLLIRCNCDRDFIYKRIKDDKQFIVDTRQLRTILGDVPLNEPDVLKWIEDYINENTTAVCGNN